MATMLKPYLTQLDVLPDGFTSTAAQDMHRIIPGPTLIHLPGRLDEPLFFSVLLHGNEPTGLLAVQELLRRYAERPLPRALSIFVGNIEAAKHGVRRLNSQPDYNRVWPGTEHPESSETRMAAEIVSIMQRRQVFASVDIHNNTGLNPHYACVNILNYRNLQLATMFSRLVVYFTRPKGVQAAAFAPICPAVTLECGKPGQQYGLEHALEYLNACLHLNEVPDHPIPEHDIDLFHTVAQITLREDASFSFHDAGADLHLDTDLDHMNFTEIPAGTVFGTLKPNAEIPVIARDEQGDDRTCDYFRVENGELVLNRGGMPSMLTLDERVIRQDCLCYLMERTSL